MYHPPSYDETGKGPFDHDIIRFNLPDGLLKEGVPVKLVPLKSDHSYYSHLDGVLTRSTNSPTGFEFVITGLHPTRGEFEPKNIRVNLTVPGADSGSKKGVKTSR